MNSDNTDYYFRKKIQSLDRVKVPGTTWTPEKSWEKIRPRRRRKVVMLWWSGGSVAAAFLLMLGYFWLPPESGLHNNSMAKVENPMESASARQPVPEFVASENKTPDGFPQLVKDAKESEPKTQSKRENCCPGFLQPVLKNNLLTVSGIQIETPVIRALSSVDQNPDFERTPFNRVYVFNRGTANSKTEESAKTDLAIYIDVTMKSTNDPPGAFLTGSVR